MDTKTTYCQKISKQNADIPFTESEIRAVAYEAPLYIEKQLLAFLNEEDFGKANRLLDVFFQKEDFKEKFKSHNPSILFEPVSPKHVEFQEFRSRIQFIQGSNKSGKSGNGSFKVRNIALGESPQCPFSPRPGQTIYGWVCNEYRSLLRSAVVQLEKWLTPEQYQGIKGQGGLIDRIIITAPNGGKTDITFKPYDAGVEAFESDNLHFIWCDEPPSLEIFEAMWARLVEFSGWLMITATTVQEESKYLDDMLKGEGPQAELYKRGLVQHTRMNMWENLNLSRRQIDEFISAFSSDSPMYKMRVMGEYAEKTGKVFKEFTQFTFINDQPTNWNAYNPNEFTQFEKDKSGMIMGLDYGREDPFACGVLYQDENETIWLDDLIYQSGLEASVQADMINKLIERNTRIPTICVADRQINNNQAQGNSILSIYKQYIKPEYYMPFRCEEMDKRDPEGAIAWLGNKISTVNPKTGKPYFRINLKCTEALKEFEGLSWKLRKKDTIRQKELTKGKDHVIAFMRYIANSGILNEGFLYKQFVAGNSQVVRVVQPDCFIDPNNLPNRQRQAPYY